MNRAATDIDRARQKLELIKLERELADPRHDALELEHLQPLRDEIDRRLRGGGRVGEPAQPSQTALRLALGSGA